MIVRSVSRSFLSKLITGLVIASFFGCQRAGSPKEETDVSTGSGDHADTIHEHVAQYGGQVQAVGDNHFELVYDPSGGHFSLYVLGSEETRSEPIPDQEISLQVRDEATGEFEKLTLGAEPLESESGGKSSRFSGTNAKLAKLENLTAVARVPVANELHRVSFQFVGGKPMSESLAPLEGFACPMNCEKGKVHLKPGFCSVCKMKLEEARDGMVAHSNHTPQHGGSFFMAADNWHHLEGTLPSEQELRIYLYDNFSQPLDSTGFSGELTVQQVDEQYEEVGEPVTVPIEPVPGKTYLTAELPATIKPPLQTEARLKFPKQTEKFLFNFDFEGVQHKD